MGGTWFGRAQRTIYTQEPDCVAAGRLVDRFGMRSCGGRTTGLISMLCLMGALITSGTAFAATTAVEYRGANTHSLRGSVSNEQMKKELEDLQAAGPMSYVPILHGMISNGPKVNMKPLLSKNSPPLPKKHRNAESK